MSKYPNADWKWIDPQLWFRQEADTKLMSEGDRILQMKLIFLAYLHNLQEVLEGINGHERTAKVIRQVLGQAPYSVEIFDTWWMIERLRPGPDYNHEMKMLSSHTLGTLAKTNNQRVDSWIQAMIDIKRSKENPDKKD